MRLSIFMVSKLISHEVENISAALLSLVSLSHSHGRHHQLPGVFGNKGHRLSPGIVEDLSLLEVKVGPLEVTRFYF